MQASAGGRTKIGSVTCGDVIDGVDGLGRCSRLPNELGSASGRTQDRRDKGSDWDAGSTRGWDFGVSLWLPSLLSYDITDACRDL